MNKKRIEVPLYLNRINHFPGQTLTFNDFKTEQNYFRDRMRLHNLNLHGIGVVSGLEVSISLGPAKSVMVAPGTALDPLGNEITLYSVVRCPLPQRSEIAYLVLYWAERETDPVPVLINGNETGQTLASRVEEYAILKYEVEADRAERHAGVVLARLVKIHRTWKVDDEFRVQRPKV
jgi:hypothetical protein